MLSSVMAYSFAQSDDIENGYNYQAKKINAILEQKSAELSHTYDFEKVSNNGKIVPSLVCVEDDVKIFNGVKLEKSEVCNIQYKSRSLYNEATKEKVTWREFLIMPVNKEIIKYNDTENFKKGINKANEKALENITIIQDMYKGMILYKILLEEGMITENRHETVVKIAPNSEKNKGEKNE